MNNKELEHLFKILSETDIHTFELEKANCKLRIKRGHVLKEASEGITHETDSLTVLSANAAETAKDEKKAEENKNIKYIVSPMVGTFYRAPSPDKQPYTEKGDKVVKGQVLCIIEAMKLFNEIVSDIDGEVADILIENGQPVEYGEKLFAIDISK